MKHRCLRSPALPRSIPALTALALWSIASTSLAQGGAKESAVVERWPNGAIRVHYSVDEEGRRHGAYRSFWRSGVPHIVGNYRNGQRNGPWREQRADKTLALRTNYAVDRRNGRHETFYDTGKVKSIEVYRKGVLHGAFTELFEDGKRKRTGKYRQGLLDGDVKITRGTKVLSRQKWSRGTLLRLGKLRPFPRAATELRRSLAEIQSLRAPKRASDPLYVHRVAALRRLMAYRDLCGLVWKDMQLNEAWFPYCDAAAEACRMNGGLSHHPSKPAGMDDARFKLASVGARSSNLASGPMLRSVDMYMDDSDPSNIARVGHRRWCLNPMMRKTAFGQSGRYSAMWSFDRSGPGAKGMEAVYYPPRGYVPVDFFGPRHAWSVGLLRGGQPKRDQLKIEIFELDEQYMSAGQALALDHVGIARSGQGTGACLIFRPRGLRVQPGARYLARLSFDKGRSVAHEYLVEFCEAVAGARRRGY